MELSSHSAFFFKNEVKLHSLTKKREELTYWETNQERKKEERKRDKFGVQKESLTIKNLVELYYKGTLLSRNPHLDILNTIISVSVPLLFKK